MHNCEMGVSFRFPTSRRRFASDTATMLEGGDHSAITFFGPWVQFPHTTHNTLIAAG